VVRRRVRKHPYRLHISGLVAVLVLLLVVLVLMLVRTRSVSLSPDNFVPLALPHPDDLVKQEEHLALLALVAPGTESVTAVKTGMWSDPTVWSGGQIPGNEAKVLIPLGMVVTVDGKRSERLWWIRVNGELRFREDVVTELLVDTLIVDVSGKLTMGTKDAPIAGNVIARIVFIDRGVIDTTWDPHLLSRGLISHGALEVYGEERTAFVSLAVAPAKGATELVLDTPAKNWRVGDEVKIPPTEPYFSIVGNNPNVPNDKEETRIIRSVSSDGLRIGVDALLYDHAPPAVPAEFSPLKMYVVHLTRNVIFQSENAQNTTRHGHIMMMHSPKVNAYYFAAIDTGRTTTLAATDPVVVNGVLQSGGENVRGRYMFHFHRTVPNAGAVPALVKGAVVRQSFDKIGARWGYVNHDSHVVFEDDVSYNVPGAGFVTEIGNEVGVFRRNFALRSINNRALNNFLPETDIRGQNDWGDSGNGFWGQSPLPVYEDNIAAGHVGFGFILFPFGKTEGGRTESPVVLGANIPDEFKEIMPKDPDGVPNSFNSGVGFEGASTRAITVIPFNTNKRNTIFASGGGLETWFHRLSSPMTASGHGDQIDDVRIWGVRHAGINLKYTSNVRFKGGIVIGNQNKPLPFNPRVIREPWRRNLATTGHCISMNVNAKSNSFEDMYVSGCTVGVRAHMLGTQFMRDMVFSHNIVDIAVMPVQSSAGNNRYLQFDGMKHLGAPTDILGSQSHYDVKMDTMIVRIAQAASSEAQEVDNFVDSDYVRYNGKVLYFKEQAASGIPFTSSDLAYASTLGNESIGYPFDLPENAKYIDKTNQQLKELYGVAFGGRVAPASAHEEPGIYGLVADACAEQTIELPVCVSRSCTADKKNEFKLDATKCVDSDPCTAEQCTLLGCKFTLVDSAECKQKNTDCKDSDSDGVLNYDAVKCPSGKDGNPMSPVCKLATGYTDSGDTIPLGRDVYLSVLTRDVRSPLLFSAIMKQKVGEIRFMQDPSLLFRDAYGCIQPLPLDIVAKMESRMISVDTALEPRLNKPARLVFYGITESNPVIRKDGVECSECTIVSHDTASGRLVVLVSGFSTYTVDNPDGSVPSPPSAQPPASPGAGGGGSSGGSSVPADSGSSSSGDLYPTAPAGGYVTPTSEGTVGGDDTTSASDSEGAKPLVSISARARVLLIGGMVLGIMLVVIIIVVLYIRGNRISNSDIPINVLR